MLAAGGLAGVIDIPDLCHAWLPVGMTLDDVQLRDRAGRPSPTPSLAIDGPGGRRLTLHAEPAPRSSRGRLAVHTEGSPSR